MSNHFTGLSLGPPLATKDSTTDWEHHAGVEGGRLGHIGGCSPPHTPRDNEVK
jgi:hypothetical protein